MLDKSIKFPPDKFSYKDLRSIRDIDNEPLIFIIGTTQIEIDADHLINIDMIISCPDHMMSEILSPQSNAPDWIHISSENTSIALVMKDEIREWISQQIKVINFQIQTLNNYQNQNHHPFGGDSQWIHTNKSKLLATIDIFEECIQKITQKSDDTDTTALGILPKCLTPLTISSVLFTDSTKTKEIVKQNNVLMSIEYWQIVQLLRHLIPTDKEIYHKKMYLFRKKLLQSHERINPDLWYCFLYSPLIIMDNGGFSIDVTRRSIEFNFKFNYYKDALKHNASYLTFNPDLTITAE